jgi:hypothetical protein
MLGWQVNQPEDGGAMGGWPMPAAGGITLTFTNPDEAPTRLWLFDANRNGWCAPLVSGVEVLWSTFVTECWPGGTQTPIDMGHLIQSVGLSVIGNDWQATPFDICLENITLEP